MSFPYGVIYGNYGTEKNVDTVQVHPLGTHLILPDGQTFVYCENGGTAASPGRLFQTTAPGANFDELAVAATSAGATSVTVTLGATSAALDAFADGFLMVEDDAGEGFKYKIASHAAISASASGTINLIQDDPIQTALTTASTVLLRKEKYKDVVIHPSPNTTDLVGVAATDIPADQYGWFQTKGWCSVLTDGTVIAGEHVRVSDAVDGAVEPLNRDGTDENEAAVGLVVEVSADTEFSLINLALE